jgi:SAM-dependent methyltransferase
MSHSEQLGFFAAVADADKTFIAGAKVLEIGSYDVNGSVRQSFASAGRYVGVDLQEGPGVDLVGFGHEIDHPDGSYDITLSAECFEHDPYWQETFTNMARMTRPGGLVAFSCASRGRLEHGTTRTDNALSPGTQAVGLDYYLNLTAADFEDLPLGSMFSAWRFWYLPTHFDLYFAGLRAGGVGATLPEDAAVQRLRCFMPRTEWVFRLPMMGLARLVGESRYQSMVVPFFGTLPG